MLEKKNKFEPYISLLSILVSNGIVVYGVIALHWNFFMVIYSYWFAEFFSTVFDRIKYRTLKRRGELQVTGMKKETEGRFFFLFVYWVFIVLIAGFIAAPENTFGENILVVFFMNKSFNVSLFFVAFGELLVYYQRFILNRNYSPEAVIAQNSMLNTKTMIMHISIIIGAFVWFSMNVDQFFIHIDAGKYGDYAFMLVFVTVRVIGELIGRKQTIPKN